MSGNGPWLDVVAPGMGIRTLCGGDTCTVNGTSFSTPIVSGIATLMLSLNSSLHDVDIERVLEWSADDIGQPGWDDLTGWGRVNAGLAVSSLNQFTLLNGLVVDPDRFAEASPPVTSWVHWVSPPHGWPSGDYYVRRHEMVADSVAFPITFAMITGTWAHVGGTNGLSAPDAADSLFYEYGWAEPFDITTSGCRMRTYVYEVLEGGSTVAWWPCQMDSVCVEYAAFGATDSIATVPPKPAKDVASVHLPGTMPITGRSPRDILVYVPRSGGSARLAVFDVAGREVSIVLDGPVAAGIHRYTWQPVDGHGAALASGVYFLAGQVDGQRLGTRLVIVR
jgi:hypothetical protein